MSGYGWLTQSTIVPKKSKEIKVNDAGLYDLKATILQYKNKKPQGKMHQKKQIVRNKGVQTRNLKDQQQVKKKTSTQNDYAYKCLLGKQKVYDSLQEKSINHKALLVDFQAKKITQNQDQQYKNLREDFYNGKLADNKRQRQQIYAREMAAGQSELRQRLNWQKQVLLEMKGVTAKEEKLLVTQSFDRKLDKDQKQALSKIITENKQKIHKDKLKNQQSQNIRKIRKPNQ